MINPCCFPKGVVRIVVYLLICMSLPIENVCILLTLCHSGLKIFSLIRLIPDLVFKSSLPRLSIVSMWRSLPCMALNRGIPFLLSDDPPLFSPIDLLFLIEVFPSVFSKNFD